MPVFFQIVIYSVLMFRRLEFVQVLIEIGQTLLETLALADLVQDLGGLARPVLRVAVHHLPVVEDALRERLAASVRAKVSREAFIIQYT